LREPLKPITMHLTLTKMSNIKLYQETSSLSLIPQSDYEISAALKSQLLNSIDDKIGYDKFKDEIVKAYMVAKWECPVGLELQVLVDETQKTFRRKYGSIRVDEIGIIFNRGLSGEYGKFMGLSLPTFCMFTDAYLKEQSRIKLLTPMEEKKEPSLAQRFETAKNLALSAFDKFADGKSIDMEGATVYRFLAGLKIIQYTDDEQHEFLANAQVEVIDRKNREKFTSLDKHVRSKIEKELGDINLLSDKIKFTAQHNGLIKYFGILSFESETPKADLLNSINQQAKQYLNK